MLSVEAAMVRTQIQLTKEQAKAIRRLATVQGVSIAEVIRRAVDQVILSSPKADLQQRQERALEIVGKFGSGKRDVSKRHDAYLAEVYKK
jgi:hypothetical protein